VPTARVWGKRHLFLLGHVLMIASCIWAGASGTNHKSLLWARVFQGVALAPFEGLVNACVGDLYFVHVRCLQLPSECFETDLSKFRNEASAWQCLM
jgi:MFS family permease